MKTKRMKGFTLVELIVVIAIIGVLAAILVPTLMGYVNKAKFTAANSTAKTLFDATMTACRETDIIHPIPDGIYTDEAHQSGSYIYDDTLTGYIYEYFDELEGKTWAVRLKSEFVVATCFQESDNDAYLGTYPYGNTEKQSSVDFEDFLDYAETGNW